MCSSVTEAGNNPVLTWQRLFLPGKTWYLASINSLSTPRSLNLLFDGKPNNTSVYW